jgi:hypothetical protein
VAKIQAVEEKTNEKLLSVKELTQQKIEALHTDKTMSVDAQFAGMLEFEESGDEIVESLDLDLGFLVE